MQELNQEQLHQNDEISLKELILKVKEWYKYLLSKWKTILIVGILGGILGFTYAYFQKPVYTAETTFVLEEGDSGGGALGAYAGLASMAGIDLGGGGGIFQGDNIIELYRSRRMIQQALLRKDTFELKQDLLINRYISFNKLRESWKEKLQLKNIDFSIPQKQFTLQHDSIMSKVVEDINGNYLNISKPDKKLSILAVQIKSGDELFAKSFADNIVATVNNFYIETKTKKSAENLNILQYQADSVRRTLNSSLGGVAAATDANPNLNPAFQALRVPSQRRQIDVQASGAIYQEIVKNLEMAKISFRNDKPLIQVIDEPVLPLNKERLGKAKGVIFGGVIFGFLTVIILLIQRVIQKF